MLVVNSVIVIISPHERDACGLDVTSYAFSLFWTRLFKKTQLTFSFYRAIKSFHVSSHCFNA